jgi:hypothetical protein
MHETIHRSFLLLKLFHATIRLQPGSDITVKRFRTFYTLILLALWLPISSHDLLEGAGLIHHASTNDAEASHDHDAADGICRAPDSPLILSHFLAAQTSPIVLSLEAFNLSPLDSVVWFASLVNPSPPEMQTSWQFSFRVALAPRAPSIS